MSIDVALQNITSHLQIPTIDEFQQWVECALEISEVPPPESCDEISIIIVDKTKSADLNNEFRHKSGPTNVLAFTYDNVPGFEPDSLGDLAICSDIVEEEAANQAIPVAAHWAHLTIHGTLHLLGYDHIDPEDAVIMEALEIKALDALGYENPYEDGQKSHV